MKNPTLIPYPAWLSKKYGVNFSAIFNFEDSSRQTLRMEQMRTGLSAFSGRHSTLPNGTVKRLRYTESR